MIGLILKSVRSRSVEYVAAIILIAAAAAAIRVQQSLAATAESQVHDLAHQLGNNILVLSENADLSSYYTLRYGDDSMPDTYPAKVSASAIGGKVKGMTPRLYGNVEIDGRELVLVGQKGVERAIPRAVSPGAIASAWGVAAATALGLSEGDVVRAGGKDLEVSLIAPGLTGGMSMAVFTELGVAQDILDRRGEINAIHMGGCWCSIDITTLAASVEKVLPGTRAITAEGVLASQIESHASVKRYSKVLSVMAAFLVAGVIAVLISFQIRRQIREIGLLLAIGARPAAVTLFFMIVAGVVGTLGVLGGFYLGVPLAARVLSLFNGPALAAAPGVLGRPLLVAILISLAAAFFPARRAATLDPTTVLREI